jgi:trimeric autotransporter adhesin
MTNGLFAVTLYFGASAFNGNARWLQIAVRPGNSTGAYTNFALRQPITPAPYAIYANAASNFSGMISASQLPASVVTNNGAGLNLSGTFTGNGANVTNVNASALGGLNKSNFWQTGGNTGANPANGNFLGTTDNQPLEFKVNNQRALRLEPGNGGVNVIGGYSGNSVATNAVGATIAGGGSDVYTNQITSSYGTIGGGAANTVSALFGVIGGGYTNTASGYAAEIGGGELNVAGGDHATIPGGYNNVATNRAFASGSDAKANHRGTLVELAALQR